MNDEQLLPAGGAQDSTTTELTPLNILRTETVLSRYPIHSLSKHGVVNIQITRRNDKGDIDLHWKVSPNPAYGMPRQLAYKLDTIVINRRIDEAGRPLPKIIRLGSLRDISKELGLRRGDTTDLKKAIYQNAFTAITAKLNYRGVDGIDQRLEAGFTRYSVVLTGEKLPNGEEADAVYVILNEPYWQVLNHAPMRPLDYDYLKALPPAAQRFYEIVSYRIFGALKGRSAEAKLKYSDYCMYSATQRYFDYDHFKKQMYKVQRPHLQSGYLKSLRYERTTGVDGKTDWIMFYVPGPKARAEYNSFTRKENPIAPTAEPLEIAGSLEEENTLGQTAKEGRGRSADDLVAEFLKRGIIEKQARKLLAHLSEGQEVFDQLEYGDQVIAENPRSFRNPPGFYISLIKDNVIPPPSFENSRRRQLREEREQAHQKWLFEEQQLRNDYELYRDQQKERYIREHLSQEEYQQLFSAAKQQYKREWPRLSDETLTEMAHGKVRGEIEPRVEFLSFEKWRKQRQQAAPLPGGQTSGESPS